MPRIYLKLTAFFFALASISFLGAADEGQKLCLTMIVKNEASVIERCLESVKGVVDCLSICDTGSTDNTVGLIEQFMEENRLPGRVYHHEWVNFGHNRTLSIETAQKTLSELGFSLEDSYLLLLDADMVLNQREGFSKARLNADEYSLMQKSADFSHYNMRLIRASLPWRSLGVTHEYWVCAEPVQKENLSTLTVTDYDDGGCREGKYERDLELLKGGLEADPSNVRYMFYLALTHKCLDQHSEAVRWCKARIDKGGGHEEVWFCQYMIGQCYDELEFWDQALHWYLKAYQFNPSRAEPLEKIATHYRAIGQTQLAYLFAKHGSQIPLPKDQVLFISQPVYDYRLDEELAISSYYTRFKEEGYAAANRLILKRNVPLHIRESAYKNLLFYVENLKDAHYRSIDIDLPLIREGCTERYHAMNPSLQKTPDGYAVICRTVNFAQSGGENYHSRDPIDPTIRTKNFLVHYDRHFKMCSQKEIIENIPRKRYPSRVLGMEDCRLVKVNQDYWFTCATYDHAPGAISQALCKVAGESTASTIDVDTFLPLEGANPSCEKNWLPFTIGNDLFVIYSCDPFLIYKVNKTTGECTIVTKYEPTHDFSRFRGSAAPVEFDDGYLMLVHEVVFNQGRFYLHRFLYLDKNFNVCKVSKPFTFMHKGIEYCCGMTIDHSGTQCILSMGIEDREAFLCTTELDNVRQMLEPLP